MARASLVRYLPAMLYKAKESQLKILFPGAGGHIFDMLHLYQLGHTVISCEAEENQCRVLFEDHQLQWERLMIRDTVVFQTTDSRLRLYCCNVTDLTPDLLAGRRINCVWDQDFLVKNNQELGQKYAAALRCLLAENFSMLMYTLRPETVKEIMDLFGATCTIRLLGKGVLDESDCSGKFFFLTPKLSGGAASKQALQDRQEESPEPGQMEYWQAQWAVGLGQWHQLQPNKHLKRYLHVLKGNKASMDVFFPLCGKSVDLVWLWKQGHRVVGLEGVPYVAESIFVESKIQFSLEYMPEIDGFKYKSSDGRLVVFACDILHMRPELLDWRFDAVFDRGGFGSVNVEYRQKYLEVVKSLIKMEDFSLLLAGFEFDDTLFKGPPRVLTKGTVLELFGTWAYVKLLEEDEYQEKCSRFKAPSVQNVIYHITNRIA